MTSLSSRLIFKSSSASYRSIRLGHCAGRVSSMVRPRSGSPFWDVDFNCANLKVRGRCVWEGKDCTTRDERAERRSRNVRMVVRNVV